MTPTQGDGRLDATAPTAEPIVIEHLEVGAFVTRDGQAGVAQEHRNHPQIVSDHAE